ERGQEREALITGARAHHQGGKAKHCGGDSQRLQPERCKLREWRHPPQKREGNSGSCTEDSKAVVAAIQRVEGSNRLRSLEDQLKARRIMALPEGEKRSD
ncbi:hypothetical protein GOP47_0014178, partial [Adiantum capillus-veneris]